MTELKALSIKNKEEIKTLFSSVFTKDPWNDDWSNTEQLEKYITGIIGNRDSIALGFFDEGKLIGIAIGNIIHWYKGSEYYIREFCISTDEQGKGFGSIFLSLIQDYLKAADIHTILLSTNLNTPAYSFYIKNNFTELETERFFYKNF